MSFLTDGDYKSTIKPEHLQAVIKADATVREQAEANAVSIVESYLFGKYNIDHEFAQSGAARKKILVIYCVRIALYELQKRLPNFKQDEKIDSDYDDTVSDLKLVVKGIKPLPLKRLTETDGSPKSRITVESVYVPRNIE